MTSENEALREAIDAGLSSFCMDTPDFSMSSAMRQTAVDHIIAQPGIWATQQDEREKLIEAGQRLAFAAGALNIATDSMDRLTNERGDVLDALKEWAAVLGGHLREQGNG